MDLVTDPRLFTLAEISDREFDEYFLEEGRRRGVERCEKDIPDLFVDAVVTVPAVADWVRALADATVTDMRGHVAAVRTGPSLLLLGLIGAGKTYQAFGAIRAIGASGIRCVWLATTAAEVYASLRPRPKVDSEAEFLRYANAQLLLLDDLGAAKGSEWVEEVNYRLINHRYQHRLPTIITSNLLAGQLNERLGNRVFSRLTEMCQRVVVTGDDRRRKSTTNMRSDT